MKTWTAQEIWNVVNKIPFGSFEEIKRRCLKTEEWLGKINAPCLMQEDKKAVTKLGNAIRKAVLARYGIGNVREIPKHEYSVAMSQVEMWNDVLIVRDVAKEARERVEQETDHENQ